METILLLFTYFSAVLATVPVTSEHFYTTNQTEAEGAATTLGFVIEGIAGYVYSNQQPSTLPLRRLYNGGISRHFYTINETESSELVASGQWVVDDKPNAGYCFPPSISVDGGQKLQRMYNEPLFDHLYTTSTAEVAVIETAGFVFETTACILPAKGDGTVPLLRLFRKCLAGQDPQSMTFAKFRLVL